MVLYLVISYDPSTCASHVHCVTRNKEKALEICKEFDNEPTDINKIDDIFNKVIYDMIEVRKTFVSSEGIQLYWDRPECEHIELVASNND